VSKYGKWARPANPTADSEPGLVPLIMWYDSMHICRANQYADLIEKEVRPGEFIESSYGIRVLEDIKSKRDEWNYEYHMDNFGFFLYRDPKIGLGAMVRHINGRGYHSREDRIKLGWPAERQGMWVD